MSAADRMLWYKSWTETRRFFIMGAVMLCTLVVALYMSYPGTPGKEFPHGAIAVGADQVRTMAADARSYIWLHWFGNTLLIWLPFLALAVAGTGIPASSRAYYALSMPVSRRRIASIRAATGFVELIAAAAVSSLLVSGLALAVGTTYPPWESAVQTLLAVAGVSAFYGLFVFLSATLGGMSKAIAGGAFLLLYGMLTFLIPQVREHSVFRLMTGDMYFLHGQIPWLTIAACLVCGSTLVWISVTIVTRRDY